MRAIIGWRSLAVLGLTVLAASCGAGAPGSGGASSGSRGPITRAEILELAPGEGTALSVVRQLRPRWLRARNPGSPSSGDRPMFATIFVDTQRLGPLEYLSQVSSQIIQRIEYLDFRDATIRHGEGYPGGIIRVVTRPTRDPTF